MGRACMNNLRIINRNVLELQKTENIRTLQLARQCREKKKKIRK